MGGLKVIGTILGNGFINGSHTLDNNRLASLHNALESITNMDSSAKIRQLAETMLANTFKPVQ
jgi:hypothetical protein